MIDWPTGWQVVVLICTILVCITIDGAADKLSHRR